MNPVLPENILKCMDKPQRSKLGKAGMTRDEVIQKQTLKNEAELQNQIASYLRLKGIAFSRSRMDKRSTTTLGWPDFIFCINRKPLAFECKMPGGKLKPEQLKCHEQMISNGWDVYIVTSFQHAKKLMDIYFTMTY